MKKIMLRISALVLMLTLISCVRTSVEVTPESMKGKGLLVAHVSASGLGWGKMINYGSARISGETYSNAIKNGYIAVPLLPGNYEFENISNRIANTINTLPIKGKFTIKAGEVTNLGEVFLMFKAKDSKSYRMIYLDNNGDMQSFLRTEYKDVYQSLHKKKLNNAEVKYVTDKLLGLVRKIAISQEPVYKGNRLYVTGPLGSIGKKVFDKKGKVKDVKWVDTGTLLNINNCSISKISLVCIVPHKTKGDQVFYAKGRIQKFYKKPKGFKSGRFVNLNNQEIYWVNDDMSFFHSKDKAKNWTSNTKFKVIGEGTSSLYSKPGVFMSRKGVYIYSGKKDSTILYSGYGSEKYQTIKPPVSGEIVRGLIETAKGLYSSGEHTAFTDGEMYYKANGTNDWKKRRLPAAGCGYVKLTNFDKDKIEVRCNGGVYASSDEGKTFAVK